MKPNSKPCILITGSAGFIGRNLLASLDPQAWTILTHDLDNSWQQLNDSLMAADFVFHLAGVNRPVHEAEFMTGNVELTEQILTVLAGRCSREGVQIPVLLSSSIQASQDNPYGISKRRAEEAVFAYSQSSGSPVFVYRLANVFGKWCRPNYNSVIATWCHAVARNQPITIDDPGKIIRFVYVDDVIQAYTGCLDILREDGTCPAPDTILSVDPVYERSLGQVADLLRLFHESRHTLMLPSMQDPFTLRLYGTYLSYLPDDQWSYPLNVRTDNRGWLAEFIKSEDMGQIFVSVTKPGITRGNHWHHTKTEKFLVVFGQGIIRFRQIWSDAVIEYPVSGDQPEVVDIPTGYTHSIENTGSCDMVTLFWASEIFNPQHPDTYYMEVSP